MSQRLSQLSSHLNLPHGLLSNQTALITGGGQGIGAEIARQFANEGAKVVIADIDEGLLYLILIFIWERKKRKS